jgi:hypothetical protein
MFRDPSGYDMIFLTDPKGADLGLAGPFGHSAVLIQDEQGDWWIATFEPASFLHGDCSIIIMVDQVDIIWDDDGITVIGGTQNHIRQWRDIDGFAYEMIIQRDLSRYTEQLYVVCDSTPSMQRARELSNANGHYWLTGRNCFWVAADIFSESLPSTQRQAVKDYLWVTNMVGFKYRRTIIPNDGHAMLKKILGK